MTRKEKLFVICLTMSLSDRWVSMFCAEKPELAKKVSVDRWENLSEEDVNEVYSWMEIKADSM